MYLASKFDEFGIALIMREIVATPARLRWGKARRHPILPPPRMYWQRSFGDDIFMVQYDPNGGYGSRLCVWTPDGEITVLSDWVFVDLPRNGKGGRGIIIIEEKKMRIMDTSFMAVKT